MAASSTVVIKVKYGDMLRRFNAQTVDDELDLSMDGLKERIISLFHFDPDIELMLTYIDEDGDVVTLVDADDLRDVVKQGLDPLRITVKLNSEKNARQFNRSSETSTPLRSPREQQRTQTLDAGVSDMLKTVPEPLREALMKLSTDLTSKASSSSPGVAEIIDYFSKVGLSYLGQLSESQTGVQPSTNTDVPESSIGATECKDSDLSKVNAATLKVPSNGGEEPSFKSNESLTKLQTEATMKNDKVKKQKNMAGGSMETSYSKELGFNAVPSALDSKNINVGKKEKVKKISECYPNEKSNLVAPDVAPPKPSEPHLGPKTADISAPDPMTGNYLDGRMRSAFPGGFGGSPGSIWSPNIGSSNFHGLNPGPSPTFECPFSGLPVDNTSAAPSVLTSQGVPFRRSSSQNEGSGIIFHQGVRCDGCGVHPITGPRFKSRVKVNYDLCSVCFSEMGNGTDYIRLDRPAVYRPPMSFKGLYDSAPLLPDPNAHVLAETKERFNRLRQADLCGIREHEAFMKRAKEELGRAQEGLKESERKVCEHEALMKRAMGNLCHAQEGFKEAERKVCSRVSKNKSRAFKLDSRFIQDVNVIDGTAMAPLTPFTKIWRMRNNGTVVWPQRTLLLWIGGDRLTNQTSVEVEIPAAGWPVDQELDIAVDFVAPELPGRYISYWRMAAPSGHKFGQRVWVLIQVDASAKETTREGVRGLNLNLPPVSSGLRIPEIINVDIEPIVENRHHEPDNSRKTLETVEPVVDLQANNEQEMKFPINDSLLVGSGASSPVPSAGPSVVNPIIDMLDRPLSPSPISNSQEPAGELPGNNEEIEEKLLRQLEEMGFKQFDLNKEILRINEYDLEQSVDHLCGVSEWDPMLEELEEMGFEDTETNKMLLKKNNGSIKRVVMDLIAGEEI